MAKKTTLKKPNYEQDAKEVAKMLAWYSDNFSEVYSLTCMNCKRVIGVEVAPVRSDGIILEKGRTFYNFNDLALSVRRRLDLNDQGQPMYGYECSCGNSTIMAAVERGEVAERTIVKDKNDNVVADTGPVATSSPYELAQTQATVKLKQAGSKKTADYVKSGKTERYETFKLERVN